MEVRYLRSEEIIGLHDGLIDEFSPLESKAILNQGAVESAAARPGQTRYYQQNSDICDLAASLAVGIALNHGFANANKRTAAEAAVVFLLLNGYWLDISNSHLVELLVQIATKEIDQNGVAEELRYNAIEMTPEEREQMESCEDESDSI